MDDIATGHAGSATSPGAPRLEAAFAALGTPAVIGSALAVAGVARIVGVVVLDSMPALFTVLSVVDAAAMTVAFAGFAFGGLTAPSRLARLSAWVLAGLYFVTLLVAAAGTWMPQLAVALPALGFVIIVAGLVFGVTMLRSDALPHRVRTVPLACFAGILALSVTFADDPLFAAGGIGVVLLLFATAMFISTRVTPQALRTPSAPRAGWYADPIGERAFRWWSGAAWTTGVSDVPTDRPATSAPEPTEQGAPT
ncbi:DUF2510 domain-containing protein [Agromyces sp. NPDC049794]|uniref:DUF2510 domain-containing protein n=1 Tax=unclassified Agromyces TaxID=2639701 RepID=UPI0033E8B683